MASAQGTVADRVLGEGQDGSRGLDGVAHDDHRAVVQRGIVREDRPEQLGREDGLDVLARASILAQPRFALDSQNRAHPGTRQLLGTLHQTVHDPLLPVGPDHRYQTALAETGECGAHLGLKDHQGSDGAVLQQRLEDAADQ